MIGNVVDARQAYNASRLRTHENVLSYDGSSRDVFLINSVVYKVVQSDWDYDFNTAEYEAIATNSHEFPANVRYPQVSIFNVNGKFPVIAMEYIEGEAIAECTCHPDDGECMTDCMTIEEYTLIEPFMSDPSGFNVIRCEDGMYVIIDAA